MILTDQEIIKKLGIKLKDKILDIGGSMAQHTTLKIDTLVDMIRPEDSPYRPSKLLAKKFIQADITKDKLPFKDKEFDVVLCTHTLEDLPTPFPIMDEMQRVGKRGLIVTPSMGTDMVFSKIDFTDWLTGARRVPGEAHHKWFFINKNDRLVVMPKNYPVLYTSAFQVIGWTGEKEMVFVWKDQIKYREVLGLNIHSLIDEYQNFLNSNKSRIKLGTALFYWDSPYNLAKALVKKILKRGPGYSFRKKI